MTETNELERHPSGQKRQRLRLLLLAAILALAGCAQQRQAAMQSKFNELAKACESIPKEVGRYVERNRCRIQAAREAGFSGPTEDLLEAERLSLAERVDGRQITPAQASLEFEEFKYRLRQDAEAANNQRAASAAAILSAMPRTAPGPAVTPYVMPTSPQPWSATCQRVGQFAYCNGN